MHAHSDAPLPFPTMLARWVDICVVTHSPWLFTDSPKTTFTLVNKVSVDFSAFDDIEIASFCHELMMRCPTLAITRDGSRMDMVTSRKSYDAWKPGFQFVWEDLTMVVSRDSAYFTDRLGRMSPRTLTLVGMDFNTENVIPWLFCQT
jgi:hypothetical protein